MILNIGEAVRQRILELCEERELSVNKLSTMSGVTQSKKLCDGLGISIEEFFCSDLFRNLEQEVK